MAIGHCQFGPARFNRHVCLPLETAPENLLGLLLEEAPGGLLGLVEHLHHLGGIRGGGGGGSRVAPSTSTSVVEFGIREIRHLSLVITNDHSIPSPPHLRLHLTSSPHHLITPPLLPPPPVCSYWLSPPPPPRRRDHSTPTCATLYCSALHPVVCRRCRCCSAL